MADRKISDLTALTTPASGDYLPIVDISEAAAASKNKRITIEELMRGVPDGTAAAAGIAFETDPNTGIYSPGADQLAVATNGTGRLFVDASGRVGVGANASTLNTIDTNNASADIVVGDGTDGRGLTIYSGATNPGSIAFARGTTGTNTYAGLIKYEHTNGSLQFRTEAVERLRITSSGLVGVGTSSPGQGQAQINTTAAGASDINAIALNLTNNSTAAGTGVSLRFSPGNVLTALRGSYINSLISGANGSDLQFWTCGDGVVPGERMRIDSSGNVGIGTSSPLSRLNTLGTQGNWRIDPDSVSGEIQAFTTNTDNSAFIDYRIRTNQTIFDTGGSERARIDSSGRLLIGTSSDAQTSTVTVQGNSASTTGGAIVRMRIGTATPADGNTTGVIKFEDSGGGTGAEIEARRDGGTWSGSSKPSRLVFSTTADGAASPTERLRITSTGQVRLAGAGITFNGDTAAANELDDYEEGTWTPVVNTSNGDATVAWSLGPNARYTKIGRQIHLVLYGAFTVSAAGTGYPIITGVPITAATAPFAGSLAYASGFNSASIAPKLYITTIDILNTNSVSAGPVLQTGYIALFMSYTV
jgi:hypothetical protein